MSSPAAQRGMAWLAMAGGAVLALLLAGRSGVHADVTRALGWALLAAVGVSLLLHQLGRRLVALLAAALALGMVLVALRGEGHWVVGVAGVLGLVGAMAQLVLAPRWISRAARYDRTVPAGTPTSELDIWKAMDAGLDPTADGFGDSLPSRETSHHRTNQEDR